MLLITLNLWHGPSKAEYDDKVPVTEYQVAYATNMTLPSALILINQYENAYNDHYVGSSINHTLLVVSPIDFLGLDILEKMNITMVEALPTQSSMIE